MMGPNDDATGATGDTRAIAPMTPASAITAPPMEPARPCVDVGASEPSPPETDRDDTRVRAPKACSPRSETVPCFYVGVDENGLGPILGPLLVTGVSFRSGGPRPHSLGPLVGDSKTLVAYGNVALGEAWARALLATLGPAPTCPADIVARVSLDDAATLQALCPRPTVPPPSTRESAGRIAAEASSLAVPSVTSVSSASPPSSVASMCWSTAGETFVADDALVAQCARAIRGWGATTAISGRFARKFPLELVGLRAAVVCPRRLNDEGSAGKHKLVVDLHQMERLALALHADAVARSEAQAHAPQPGLLDAVCGKVGGMDFYGRYFGPLSMRLHAIDGEGPARSAYSFPGLGRIAFVRDADASDPLVGLASLVGKYLRELLMGRIVRYMREAVASDVDAPSAPPPDEILRASGYRDPTTRKFILATERVRAERGVPTDCFLRRT